MTPEQEAKTEKALADIYKERLRQEDLVRIGKFAWTCSNPSIEDEKKLAVLAEEFGEVSKEVMEMLICRDRGTFEELPAMWARLRTELVQVGAVCAAWAAALDVE
jgi:hypothetical protein